MQQFFFFSPKFSSFQFKAIEKKIENSAGKFLLYALVHVKLNQSIIDLLSNFTLTPQHQLVCGSTVWRLRDETWKRKLDWVRLLMSISLHWKWESEREREKKMSFIPHYDDEDIQWRGGRGEKAFRVSSNLLPIIFLFFSRLRHAIKWNGR